MIIDLHAHYMAPDLFKRLLHDPAAAPSGVSLDRAENGKICLRLGKVLNTPMPAEMDDLEQRRKEMARQGVDAQWLTPTISLAGYDLDPRPGAAWSRMVNQTTAEALKGQSGFWGAATVPLQDGRRAAQELEHALGLGLKGAIIGTHAAGKSLDDADLETFWAAAAATRAPILIHPFGIAHGTRLDRYHMKNLVGNPADTTVSAGQIIFAGICDRYPDLKVLLVHGGGFFPYQAGRWDRGFQVRKEAQISLRRPPSDALRWFYYDTVTHSSQALRFLANIAGADRIALGTDYPYDMGDPDPIRTIHGANLSNAEQVQIKERTALSFLGL
ncbi:MAG TPA: amidohydrolase family protein [bacterium]|nr:amidohydrolase family protein [bacterium]